jgi:phosphoinositide-3-kinase regulatory subunit 4
MGQGASGTATASGITADSFLPELGNVAFDRRYFGLSVDASSRIRSIGKSRFLRSLKARHSKEGALVVKIYAKPTIGAAFSYQEHLRQTEGADGLLGATLMSCSVSRIASGRRSECSAVSSGCRDGACRLLDAPVYRPQLVRSHQVLVTRVARSSISTRPFLTLVEKKWIAYQLLTALAASHARKVRRIL